MSGVALSPPAGARIIKRKVGNAWIRLKRLAKVPLLPVAFPLFVLMRLLRPLILIRLNSLRSEIGHFAANTELYLCERDAGVNRPNPIHVDLSFFGPTVPNQQLAIMWGRTLRILPRRILAPIHELNLLLPGGGEHCVGTNAQEDRDVNDLLINTRPHVAFTRGELQRGQARLRAMGVPEGAEFVCLIARDDAYHKQRSPDKDFDYHSYRNASIQNYALAAETLAARGYWVIRMGAVVREPLRSEHPAVIDYATSGERDDFMDVYLGAHCAFCISSGIGFDAIPQLFRRPMMYVNLAPVGYLPTWTRGVSLCKQHVLISERRWLSLREIVERDLASCLTTACFAEKGVQLVENSPQAIADVADEMAGRLSGTWVSCDGDEEAQRRFWGLYPSDLRDPFRRLPLHGTIRSRYSAHFLRNNPAWLD